MTHFNNLRNKCYHLSFVDCACWKLGSFRNHTFDMGCSLYYGVRWLTSSWWRQVVCWIITRTRPWLGFIPVQSSSARWKKKFKDFIGECDKMYVLCSSNCFCCHATLMRHHKIPRMNIWMSFFDLAVYNKKNDYKYTFFVFVALICHKQRPCMVDWKTCALHRIRLWKNLTKLKKCLQS